MEKTKVYQLSQDVRIEISGEGHEWEGALLTPDDPEGVICRVSGFGHLEALGALTQMYCRWLHRLNFWKFLGPSFPDQGKAKCSLCDFGRRLDKLEAENALLRPFLQEKAEVRGSTWCAKPEKMEKQKES
jgi:hypothetical protein